MSNPKNKPGIHLLKRVVYIEEARKNKSWFWWRIVATNGRTIARSTETYSRKANAIKSLKSAAKILSKISKGKYRDQTNPLKPSIRSLSVIILIALFASCVPAKGPYGCPKDVTKVTVLEKNKKAAKLHPLSDGWIMGPPLSDSLIRLTNMKSYNRGIGGQTSN